MVDSLDFNKKTFLIITGASRGIGRTIAIEYGKKLQATSTLLLLASSEDKLLETKNLIQNPVLTVHVKAIDLTAPDKTTLENIFNDVLNGEKYENAVIIHNVGTIGDLTKTSIQLTNMADWQKYYSLNFFTPIIFNSLFVERFLQLESKIFIINITSLCGRQPFPSLSQYGSAKAARDLFFKVLAKEYSHINVLNYSPGPVDTDMANSILVKSTDQQIKEVYKQLFTDQTILTPEMTVHKLLTILENGKFESGAIIDYYD
ncbi:sepiapterin reductase-like [Chrysoperla carnea]|uniref:sepiapterin reductase-like n=1 Tax=Chrysoperla carnea TaxID=189513 RepID=UPI001D08FDC2|nr:sepiapterin reductase-like [Chrysoperla carnea]